MQNIRGESPRRVLVLEPLGDGGIAHYAFNLVRALRGAGVEPVLCTARRYEFKDEDWPEGSLRTSLFRVAFALIGVFPRLDVENGAMAVVRRVLKVVEYPFNAAEAAIAARFRGIRVLHLQTVNSVDLLVVLAARLTGLKVVTTVHNVNPLHGEMTGFHWRLLKMMYKCSHRLIIHTDAGKTELCNLFDLPAKKVSVIPHGDYSFFVEMHDTGQEAEASRPEGQSLLFFGAIRPNKGLDILLEAMPRVLKAYPDCRLLIVGEPVGGFDMYRNAIEHLELSEAVSEVLHYVENFEVAGFFGAASVAVLPYREITQSGVLQIAFACGTPVVASDLPGFREVIESGVSGLLVPPEDALALADACCQMLAEPSRARSMGAAAQSRMRKEFSWPAIAQRTEDEVYGQVT